MKFQEAFDKAFEIHEKENKKKNNVFAITPGTAKILAFLWTMLAVAEKRLDDFCFVDDNNTIISIPIKGQTSSSTNKTADKKAVEEDVEKTKKQKQSE